MIRYQIKNLVSCVWDMQSLWLATEPYVPATWGQIRSLSANLRRGRCGLLRLRQVYSNFLIVVGHKEAEGISSLGGPIHSWAES